MTTPPPLLAGHVNIARTVDGALNVTIDGQPFPYLFAPLSPVHPVILAGELPQVTFTIAAEQVTFDDSYGVGHAIDPEHDHEDGELEDDEPLDPCGEGCTLTTSGGNACLRSSPACHLKD